MRLLADFVSFSRYCALARSLRSTRVRDTGIQYASVFELGAGSSSNTPSTKVRESP